MTEQLAMALPGLPRYNLPVLNATTVAPAPVRPAPVREEKREEEPDGEYASDYPWHVVLLDDNQHTYDYVIEMLSGIFGYTLEKAFVMACEVDLRGRVIVATCHLELAEMRQEQIHTYGPDWRIPSCKGSMSAVLEPAR
jgi:ATP-dependent Clp protease adaptor protein ClpS